MRTGKGTRIVVLRWGHRFQRDSRLTSHVALVARAMGAHGFILADVKDSGIEESVKKVSHEWGGAFSFEMGLPWKKSIEEWRSKGNIVVHLTAYGENIEGSDVLERIRVLGKDIMVIVGSQKVPSQFFSEEVSNFNVAVGNQPHSECGSLAVFLDRYFKGEELTKQFKNARIRIVPRERGKRTVVQKPRRRACLRRKEI